MWVPIRGVIVPASLEFSVGWRPLFRSNNFPSAPWSILFSFIVLVWYFSCSFLVACTESILYIQVFVFQVCVKWKVGYFPNRTNTYLQSGAFQCHLIRIFDSFIFPTKSSCSCLLIHVGRRFWRLCRDCLYHQWLSFTTCCLYLNPLILVVILIPMLYSYSSKSFYYLHS